MRANAGCVVDHRSRVIDAVTASRLERRSPRARRRPDGSARGRTTPPPPPPPPALPPPVAHRRDGRPRPARGRRTRPWPASPRLVERRDVGVAARRRAARRSDAHRGRRGRRRSRGLAGSRGARRRTRRPLVAAGRRRRPSESESLPELSMSSTRTVTSSPRLRTSSTRSMRLPRPSFEMWSRPSRPGRMLTNAPNLVMFTTWPVYSAPSSAVGGSRISSIRRRASSTCCAVLGADAHRADHAVVAHRHVGARLLGDRVDDLALGPDHLADLVHRDLEADDLRCGRRTSSRGSAIVVVHHVEDLQPGVVGLAQRLARARRPGGRRSSCRAGAR